MVTRSETAKLDDTFVRVFIEELAGVATRPASDEAQDTHLNMGTAVGTPVPPAEPRKVRPPARPERLAEAPVGRWQLRIVQRDLPERILPLTMQPITIGRRESHTIVPDCDRVSRDHAKFSLGDAGPHVEDLGSRNGIRVNGAKMAAADLIAHDVVKVGSLRIYVEEVATDT